jgi:hypothetical protein
MIYTQIYRSCGIMQVVLLTEPSGLVDCIGNASSYSDSRFEKFLSWCMCTHSGLCPMSGSV